MKNILMILSLLLTGACGPVMETNYQMVPPRTESGRMCANNCLLSQQNCRQHCQIQESQCIEIERLRAQSDYLSYMHQRQREGRPIKKTESDFYSRNRCDNGSCEAHCGNDYRICHTNCGGEVLEQTVCTAFCN